MTRLSIAVQLLSASLSKSGHIGGDSALQSENIRRAFALADEMIRVDGSDEYFKDSPFRKRPPEDWSKSTPAPPSESRAPGLSDSICDIRAEQTEPNL